MTADEFAKSIGYKGAKPIGRWHRMNVFKPLTDAEGYIGLPMVIFFDKGEYRLSTPEEALKHFDERGWF